MIKRIFLIAGILGFGINGSVWYAMRRRRNLLQESRIKTLK